MKQSSENKKLSVWDILKLFIPLIPLALLLSYYYFEDESERKLLREQGINTECVVIERTKGKMGSRARKEVYNNKCQYLIDGTVHYCNIITRIKPLPINERIEMRYFQFDDGRVNITFPDSMKKKYKEFGFNNYPI